MDGFGVVSEFRTLGFTGPICVHSNRFSVEDSKKGLHAGADLVLPKPMSRAHLLSIVASAVSKEESIQPAKPQSPAKPLVVVVDDDALVLMGWEMELKYDVELIMAESIDELMQKLAADPSLPERMTCVITDFWFGKENALDQNIIGKLRAQNYIGPIFLSSSAGAEHDFREFSLVIPKQSVGWGVLCGLIDNAAIGRLHE